MQIPSSFRGCEKAWNVVTPHPGPSLITLPPHKNFHAIIRSDQHSILKDTEFLIDCLLLLLSKLGIDILSRSLDVLEDDLVANSS